MLSALITGPNAVLAGSREGYSWRDIDKRDIAEMASFRYLDNGHLLPQGSTSLYLNAIYGILYLMYNTLIYFSMLLYFERLFIIQLCAKNLRKGPSKMDVRKILPILDPFPPSSAYFGNYSQ